MKTSAAILIMDNSPPAVTEIPVSSIPKIATYMKKMPMLAIAALFLTLNANSQITKGNWMVGGNASFSSTKYTNGTPSVTINNIEVAPNVGYFLTNKFAAGILLDYSYGHSTSNGSNASTIQVGPFVRYYLLPSEKTVNIFAQSGYTFGSISTFTRHNVNTFSLLAGPVFYFNSSVGMEFTVGYITKKYGANSYGSVNTIQLGIGFQIHLDRFK